MCRGGKLVVVWTLGVISECYFYCLMPKSGAKKEEKEEEGRFIFSTPHLVEATDSFLLSLGTAASHDKIT